ncbi:DNA internalization-related competence protein ComEC/Rec2 [Phascolarctobacterium sp.]|uniref:DNA internalization-related competence protein ComEC/Rec2 n=1 Tax=Phascolarctobacterium sp. TaxID=2049039 RepID=UPI003867479A
MVKVIYVVLACVLSWYIPWKTGGELTDSYYGSNVVLEGRVEPASVKVGEGYTSIILDCNSITQGNLCRAYSGRVRLGLKDSKNLPKTGSLLVSGTLVPLTTLRNPGCFDGELYNRINNFKGRLKNAKLLAAQANCTWQEKLQLANLELRQRLQQGMGTQSGTVLSGMLLGGSGVMEDEVRNIFAINGISHVLAVSGTHLLLLAGLLRAVLGVLPVASWVRKTMIIVVLACYALLCGLKPPIVRAFLMSSVLLVGGTGAARGRLLCLAASAMLLVKPLWFYDIGFQLSFAAAAGLLWLLPKCQRLLPETVPDFLREGIAVTLAAQLATLPLTIGYFHVLTPYAIISNIVLLPLLEMAAFLGLLGLLLPFGQMLLQAADFLMQAILVQGTWLATLPGSSIVIGCLPLWCGLVYYAFLLLWAYLPAVQFFTLKERGLLLFALGMVLTGMLAWQQLRPQPLTAYFLDVGQGDCLVVTGSNGRTLVYDTGGLKGLDTGSRVISPFLRSLGKGKVDTLVLSHYDFDHAGGAAGLLKQLQVDEVVLPKQVLDKESVALFQSITAALQAQGSKVTVVREGLCWDLGECAVAQVVAVPEQAVTGNDASTVLGIYSPHGSLLATGDLGSEGESAYRWQQHTVLKAGHHGSKGSSSEAFLAQVRPQYVVISCGTGNAYGHPHQETLQRLQDIGSKILRTDEDECVVIEFTSIGISVISR